MRSRALRVTPVKRKAEPRYPTRDYLRDHPELLDLIPQRWRNNRLVLGALSGAVFLMAASDAVAADKPVSSASARVAPIFIHGDGRGAFGCIAVNPPVFLSEEEARSVITDEARKAGLDFAPDALTVKQTRLPVTNPFAFLAQIDSRMKEPERPVKVGEVVLDGYDRKRQVAYEYVSHNDFDVWVDKTTKLQSSVYEYDLKGTADVLRVGLAAASPSTYISVFYDPVSAPPERKGRKLPATDAEWKTVWEKRKAAACQISEQQLREQVRDFIAWLKAQGVI